MIRRLPILFALFVLVLATACGHHNRPAAMPTPLTASPKTVDSMWSVANALVARKKWNAAIIAFERAELELQPGDHRILLGRMYLGDMYVREGSDLEGVREYRRLSDEFPTDSLAPEALLRAGDAYMKLWRRPDLDPSYGLTAQSTWQELIARYPAAPASKLAEQRINELENRLATKMLWDGKFYVQMKAYDAAIIVLKELFATWPHSTSAPDAVMYLVETYRKLKQPEDASDMCGILRSLYPKTPKLDLNCPATPVPAGGGKPKGP